MLSVVFSLIFYIFVYFYERLLYVSLCVKYSQDLHNVIYLLLCKSLNHCTLLYIKHDIVYQ